jgi:hypothetical protein
VSRTRCSVLHDAPKSRDPQAIPWNMDPGSAARHAARASRCSASGARIAHRVLNSRIKFQTATSEEAVIPRESGVSSMPRTFVSITNASEYWIARFRGRRRPRVWRARILQTHLRVLAARCVRGLHLMSLENQGRRESRVPVAPAASRVEKNTRVSHHRSTGTPGLPCAMVLTAYFALSPVTGLCCHRR